MADFKLGIDPTVSYPPVGRCIYCPNDGSYGLGDEHIIPYALNGTQILRQASCHDCERITSYLDGFISREVFYQIRTSARMRSRSGLPAEFPVTLHFDDGREERVMVPSDIHPSTLVLPKFAMPTLLSGATPDGNFHFTYTRWMRESAAFDAFVRERGAKTAEVEMSIKPQQFSRVLAKIAHSYAVAKLGLEGFRPLLIDLIHQRNVERGPELVGSEAETPPVASDFVHELSLVPHPTFVVVRIRLFASSDADGIGMPVYLVVAGYKISQARRIACWIAAFSRKIAFTQSRKNTRAVHRRTQTRLSKSVCPAGFCTASAGEKLM